MQTAMTSASTATASAFSTRTLLHLVAGGIVGLIAWEVSRPRHHPLRRRRAP